MNHNCNNCHNYWKSKNNIHFKGLCEANDWAMNSPDLKIKHTCKYWTRKKKIKNIKFSNDLILLNEMVYYDQ